MMKVSRTTLVAAVLVTLAAGLAVPSATAAAAPGPEHLRVSLAGADLIRWSWDRLPGADSYEVSVSSSVTMAHPVLRSVDNNWATFEGLTRGHTYYAVVRAVTGATKTAQTAKVAGRPGFVSSFRVVGGSSTSLVWSWSKYVVRDDTQQLATGYVIRLSSSPTMKYYRTRRAVGPESSIGRLDPGTTYYAQIEALDHDKVVAPFGPVKTGHTAG